MDITPPDPQRTSRRSAAPPPTPSAEPPFALRPQPRRSAATRSASDQRVCRVLPLKVAQGPSVSLVRLLDRTIPEVHFTAHADGGEPDWVWLCGFEPDHLERVRAIGEALRVEHPRARLIVTGRAIDPTWREALAPLGVELALPWPYPLQELRGHFMAPVV